MPRTAGGLNGREGHCLQELPRGRGRLGSRCLQLRQELHVLGDRVGSLQFRIRPSLPALFHTLGASCASPVLVSTLCRLRRDMVGSATPPFGSSVTRLQSSRSRFGPVASLPSTEPCHPARAIDAPLGTRGSLHAPGVCFAAHWRAYRDRTHTRWPDTASRRHPVATFSTHHATPG